uniref:dTDP-glucose 4,6-dehydratase n=2 Tax=Aromatoleum buckelii TaxID=200254 RepID=A0ABX1N046_9RHOO
MAQMREMHGRMLWTHFAIITLGLWCLTAPAILGYMEPGNWGAGAEQVTTERALAPLASRAAALAWSDIASGALLVVFGTLSLFWRHRWAQWGSCFTGIWLLAAPLVFWSPEPASYANDTLVGALAIAFSILVPMMPGMSMEAMHDERDIPPGWSYSPSAWSQRLPMIALAFVGFFIARYLTAYQMGHVSTVWDPFFDDGTARIITSDVSRAWPIPDAGLGAMSYLLEALSGMMGGRQRWRTMPWMVAMFGVLVIPLGAVSIFFIIIQPIVIGTWCTLCLASAAAMVFMLPYAIDEVVAMTQFLIGAKRAGQPLSRVFWHGGVIDGAGRDERPPLAIDATALDRLRDQARVLPKALILATALGIWLMFTRTIFGTDGAMADSDHLIGALVFTVSITAYAETARPLRALNMVFGAWLIVAPWVLDGGSAAADVAGIIVGALLIVLAIPRGPVVRSYAGWDRYLVW